jgi:transitional endoplasmic reticulum ATPase
LGVACSTSPGNVYLLASATFVGFVVSGLVVGVVAGMLAHKVLGGFFVGPIAWIVGVPIDSVELAAEGKFKYVPAAKTQGGVGSNESTRSQQTSQNAQRESSVDGGAIEFDWTRPTLTLEKLAGMVELKSELLPVLSLFRGYAEGKGVISDRNGILLSGPPGNGKTTFAEAIAGDLGLPLIKISGKDIQSKWVNESGKYIKALFAQAAAEPCVIFFDEFETLAGSRANAGMHGEDKKVVTALLPEIDAARKKRIVLIAATNYVDQVDSAIMRDGRFDFRIEIPYPDLEARIGILKGMLAKYKVGSSDEVIGYVAKLWERRSVAFIESTVKRVRDNGVGKLGASVDDFKTASREASRRASAIPKVGSKLSELALPKSVREEADSLLYRVKNWEKIAERGGEAPSGVLLYGPPGTGKTNFVRAFARELGDTHVFEVNATDVIQDPRKFRDTVELAANHRPAIVFIDEADELLRERVTSANAGATNEILKNMDGMMGKVPEVLFMAATNNAEFMDAAALRGGRFAEKIYMGLLEGDDLVVFLQKELASKTNVAFDESLTAQSLGERFGPIAPANALSILRKAINYTFNTDGTNRPVGMAEIEKAIEASTI